MQLMNKNVRGIGGVGGDMGARFALVCLILGLCTAVLRAELQFPFPAQVVEDVAMVRAGVGTTYYVVIKLKKGDVVTVDEKIYQWYKIVPPQGVYSYVSKAFVDAKGDGKVGVVNKTPCEVFTASINGVADSFRRTANLLKGDTVNIVDEDGGYYKIMPPKGTYVYIPESAVKPAEFKPAAPDTTAPETLTLDLSTPKVSTPVTPKPASPVAVVRAPDVSPIVVKPATPVAPKPVDKPLVIERIITPEPEAVVLTKPVEVALTTPAPSPKPEPVVMPAPVVSEPASKPVQMSDSAPRPLVISKPLPGDSLPSVSKPDTVLSTPVEAKPDVSGLPVRRTVPPIPDTETPPSFEGLPEHAAKPLPAPAPVSVAVAMDTHVPDTTLPAAVKELVVDKPMPMPTPDRIVAPVPAKPVLPVVVESTELKPMPMPEISRFPVETAKPIQTPVVAGSDPVSVNPVVERPAPVASRPVVNPLKASLKYFQPQSELVKALEGRLVAAYDMPLEQIPLDQFLSAYQKVGQEAQLSIGDQRIIQARLALLKRDMNLANALKQIGHVQRDVPVVAPALPTTPQAPATPTALQFDMVGKLMASSLYDGQSLPRLFRLVNPANTNMTVAYVRPSEQVDLAPYLGKVVGITGNAQVDDSLHVNVVDPKDIALVEPR